MTDEELVERLRDKHCCESPNCNCDEAADRIEALQQALKDQSSVSDRLAEANEKLTAERDEAWRRAEHVEEQWGRCEAKLAKAVEAIRNVVEEYDLFRKNEYERGLSPLDDEIHEARTTLAEIEGEKK